MNKVYLVKVEWIYDDCEEIIGVADTPEAAHEMIVDTIKNVYCCGCARFAVDEWDINKRYSGGVTIRHYNKDEVIKLCSEVCGCE